MRLSGKTALITGATSGIGRATAEAFLKEGVESLIVTGQDAARLEDARSALATHGRPVHAVRWRADEPGDADTLANYVKERFSGVDVVFANAGVTWPAPLGQIEAAAAQAQMMINVTAPLLLIQAIAPMIRDGGSVVLNTSCLNELGMPGMAVYAASKAALRSVARTLSVELGEKGVRVNSVAPGPIETPIYGKLGMPAEQLEEMAAGIVANVPAGRFGAPREVAEAVLFLASDASSYMRGAEIPVDGGWTSL